MSKHQLTKHQILKAIVKVGSQIMKCQVEEFLACGKLRQLAKLLRGLRNGTQEKTKKQFNTDVVGEPVCLDGQTHPDRTRVMLRRAAERAGRFRTVVRVADDDRDDGWDAGFNDYGIGTPEWN